ncbi:MULTISPECIES: TerB family tellurite resistance protein [Roseobacteraceae]|uniref:tellurite resistance TerB family protein n=1 Tax=Roseobacteraceae TaxID=2854170 RepID=UPI001C4478DA|nr:MULTISPECIES: TerB family tellurite resistance protein [Roseobacteraceae]MBV7408846.1 TerB family tellurite resistance protein [Maritimibacter sp. DP1N21-5]MBY5934467.1 TerB family tellurite resistance protein [Tateyamaria omphalii]
MFERLFPKRPKETAPLPEPTPQLALGALLVRVAMADREYQAPEVAAIDKILAATFNLKPLEAAKLRATCEALERHAPGTPEYTDILRETVAYEDRRGLAVAMWQVLLADGDHARIEEDVLHQIEAALAITPEDSAAIRTQALGD